MRKWLTAATAVLAAGAMVTVAQAHPGGTAKVIHITALQNAYRYDTKSVTAPAGPITIVFINRSAHRHNISLEQGETEYGATLTIGPGSTSAILTLKKGVYHYYSSFGKDEDRGMSGTLTVK
jgi:plastocyanin